MKEKVPYMKLADACEATGLSQWFLRRGCKDGSIPCTKSGRTYYVNVPALMEKLDAKQRGAEVG